MIRGCLVGGMTVGGRTATCVRLLQRCSWLQQPDHLCWITMQISIGFSFFLLSCFISLFDCVMEFCLCKYHNPYVSTETPIFYFISNPKQYFLFLIWCYLLHWISQTSCSNFIDVACYNHSRAFDACCKISMYITVILAVMQKNLHF
jgi:hypothetical protein